MESVTKNNKRIAKNTLFLYGRMLFSLIVSFFTAGIVLNTLGVEDYGIYNVVGGLVSMFSLISGSLSAASSRFITFELGKKDGNPRKVFNASLQIHIIMSIIILMLLETIGLWFLYTQLTIPYERLDAAIWVYHFSCITFLLSILSVTYNADIIANEHMDAYAYISILETILRLVILYLLWMGDFDKLILYGFLQMMVSILIQSVYMIYCRINFPESKISFLWDSKLIRSMISFSGWNFIGASSNILRGQGVNMLINMYCGPSANAARGIGMRVNGMVSGFGHNMLTAINPQITKKFADNDIDSAKHLVYISARYGFLLLFFLAFPLMPRMDTLLTIWLHNVPNLAVDFANLALILSLSEIISAPLITLMLATGNIKWYQIIVGGCQLLNIPLSLLLLNYGVSAQYTMVVAVFVSLLCLYFRLIMLNKMIALDIKTFSIEVLMKIVFTSMLAFSFYFVTNSFWGNDVLSSFTYILVCFIINAAIIYFVGLNRKERSLLIKYTRNISKNLI